MSSIKKLLGKRWFRWCLFTVGVIITLFIFRNPILRSAGHYLVANDELQATDACFVLGGNSYDRGLYAVEVHKQFSKQKFVATGGNYPTQIQALDTVMYEAELTKHFMQKLGVPQDQIAMLTQSTSTMEESEEILAYCKQHQLSKIAVLSSAFHLRRVKRVFEKKFKRECIDVVFFAAPDQDFDANNWWKNEEGLITVNNEFIKLFYYVLKY
jgi:uncharacterized SAM-binding protein YcdF (DUF218 family)